MFNRHSNFLKDLYRITVLSKTKNKLTRTMIKSESLYKTRKWKTRLDDQCD